LVEETHFRHRFWYPSEANRLESDAASALFEHERNAATNLHCPDTLVFQREPAAELTQMTLMERRSTQIKQKSICANPCFCVICVRI